MNIVPEFDDDKLREEAAKLPTAERGGRRAVFGEDVLQIVLNLHAKGLSERQIRVELAKGGAAPPSQSSIHNWIADHKATVGSDDEQ